MKFSTTLKILLALFLAVFAWFVVISIQAPRQRSAPPTAPELRQELLSRSEDITLEVGDISITAAVQENYKNGEIHFRDFTMTQRTETRSVTVTGQLAQTEIRNSEVLYMEMEGDVHVVSSDGLDLHSRTLNYLKDQERIFTQTPVRFTLKNLKGRADRAYFLTKSRLLELTRNVKATYYPSEEITATSGEGEEAAAESQPADAGPESEYEETTEPDESEKEVGGSFETEPTDITCEKLVFDQENHRLILEDQVQLSQTGSFLKAGKMEAELTDDNRRFAKIVAFNVRSRSNRQNHALEAVESESDEEGHISLVQRAGGIKTLKSERLTFLFDEEGNNLMRAAVAEGDAFLEIEPTSKQQESGGKEVKRLFADRIEARFGSSGEGMTDLIASNEKGKARIEVEPLKKPKSERTKNDEDEGPKIIIAQEINAKIDPSTGDFSTVLMSGEIEMHRGDTVATGSSGKFNENTDQLEITGKPVLRDEGKQVSAEYMLVSLGIGDLTAQGAVNSRFFPREEEEESDIFAIGEKAEETTIAAGGLRLDYRNNVLRYTGNVVALQGENKIESQNLDIFQADTRLIATGLVRATLIMLKSEEESPESAGEAEEQPISDAESGEPGEMSAEAEEQPPAEDQTSEAGEASAQSTEDRKKSKSKGQEEKPASADGQEKTTVRLQAERLDFDKKHGILLLNKTVKAQESGMIISCQQLRYDLGSENRLKKAYAQGEVQITIGPKIIYGDKAEYYVAEQVLVVQGKNVKLWESGKLEANHDKLTFDIANDTLRFDARADQLLKTRISTN